MKTNATLTITLILSLLFTFNFLDAQSQTTATTQAATIEVIQFHSEHRCMTCLKIEELTQETLKAYSQIPFRLVNVDDKKNEKIAEQFEAAGTALFLYNPKTGKKKDLTDFAFMNAMDHDKFIKELKKHIDAFLKS